MDQPQFLTTGQVAIRLHMSSDRVRRLVKQGRLTAYRTAEPSAHRRYDAREVEALRLEMGFPTEVAS